MSEREYSADDTGLVRALRKQVKAANRKAQEKEREAARWEAEYRKLTGLGESDDYDEDDDDDYEAEIDEPQAVQRDQKQRQAGNHDVAVLLKDAGVDPRYARFYDGEVDAESVHAWINEQGDLLGHAEPEIDAETRQQIERVSYAASNAPPLTLLIRQSAGLDRFAMS